MRVLGVVLRVRRDCVEESMGRVGYLGDSGLECCLVLLRRLAITADLANELESGRSNLVVGKYFVVVS